YYPCQADGDDLIILDPDTVDPALLPTSRHHTLHGVGAALAGVPGGAGATAAMATGTGTALLTAPRPVTGGEPAGRELVRFSFPRQRRDRHLCLADFFRPVGSGQVDVVAFQIATMGNRIAEATGELFAKDAYRDYLELHGLSVQLTEALAEYWHARVRSELGIGGDESLADMLKVNIAGCRYSFGYPACPNLEDQAQLFTLLDPARIGVELSPEYQLHPEQSTSALVAHHPEAKYFNV
ncbi:vitamin B12 dependent-methionine synthase activation domain-containing protein, partial [Sphaerisporangium aureirubrum]|uniref:vitamin B12 dependent-methionine synthase activation domain-containing protein n=1 Tax=Sphaerisporangium aureirubrum TaxID=1544736 RepID=UPI0036352299